MTLESARPRPGATPAYQISSVDRALSLLTLIGERSQVLVSEAAMFLGTSPSTAHRILQMLVLHGYVVQGEHRAYRRGPAMVSLSLGVPAPKDFVALAKPHIVRLRDQLDGTVHLVTLEGNGARFVAGAQPSQLSSPARVRPGWLLPAHVVAGGKVLLAELSTESLTLLFPGGVPITRHGRIHSFSHLRRELADVRRAGYARNVGEAVEDVAAVAIAVPWIAGVPRFSFSVGWCDSKRLFDDEATIVNQLRAATEEFAAELGAGCVTQAS